MSLSKSIPIGAGLAIGGVALALVVGAMFLTDQSEEALHLYKQIYPQNKLTTSQFPTGGPMELQGTWQGLTIVGLKSPLAQQLGVGEAEAGVMVAGLNGTAAGAGAQAAGLQRGDIIMGVDGKAVRDLSDMYTASRAVDPMQPVLLDVRRQGQPVTLVMPPSGSASPVAAAAEQEGGAPGGGLGGFGRPGAPALPAAWGAGQLYCPRDGLMVPMAAAAPSYRCPRCQSPLTQLPGMAR